MTLQERYITALKLRGSQIVPSRSKKYITMTRPEKPGTFYFIGRAGAVRYGRSATQSFAAGDKWKAGLLDSVLTAL